MGFEMIFSLFLRFTFGIAIVQTVDRKEGGRERGGPDRKGPRARTRTCQKRNHATCQSAAHRLSDMTVPTNLELLFRCFDLVMHTDEKPC